MLVTQRDQRVLMYTFILMKVLLYTRLLFISLFLFTSVDYRVQPLVMLVKRWAKTHNINDASLGTLSSYALALMVIHYLQGMFEMLPT